MTPQSRLRRIGEPLFFAVVFLVALYLAQRGMSGADYYRYRAHGLGDWRIVAIHVSNSVEQYRKHHGSVPDSVDGFLKAGLLDISAIEDPWPYWIPSDYREQNWRLARDAGTSGITLEYDIPPRSAAPGLKLQVSPDGSYGWRPTGPWRPLWWHDVIAPYGLLELLGLEVYS